MGVAQVPAVPMPPSELTTLPRQTSVAFWHRCVELHGWPVWAVVAGSRHTRSSSSQLRVEAQSDESMQLAPAAPRVRQLPRKQVVIATHSLSVRQVAPGGPLAVQTERQNASPPHSELEAQLSPRAFRARQVRVESQ